MEWQGRGGCGNALGGRGGRRALRIRWIQAVGKDQEGEEDDYDYDDDHHHHHH